MKPIVVSRHDDPHSLKTRYYILIFGFPVKRYVVRAEDEIHGRWPLALKVLKYFFITSLE